MFVDDVRYFFYITNDREFTTQQVIYESNDRCNQEKLIEQLKSGARALHAPTNTLLSNWAYSVMTALAWSLKARMAAGAAGVSSLAGEERGGAPQLAHIDSAPSSTP